MKDSILSFQDIFKKDFLANSISISFMDIATTMSLALAIGILIFFVYRFSFQGVVYSHTFNTTLLGMTLITAILIRAISSNVILSLGMVGALSIVRFRAAIKDPKDIMYLFWAIAMGITCGAGLYILSIFGAVFIAIVLFILGNSRTKKRVFLLIVRYEMNSHREVLEILRDIKYTVKSRVVTNDIMELMVEVKRSEKNDQTGFITSFSSVEGVKHASIVEYNGDYTE